MKKRVSIVIFMITVLIMSNCAFASINECAKSTVTKSENGIKVTKTAKWYNNDKSSDKNLIQVDIDVDVTDANVSELKGTTTDMVFVLDISSSMSIGDKFANLKNSSSKLFKEFLNIECGNRRVGLVTFGIEYNEVVDLTSDFNRIENAIQGATLLEAEGTAQTNLQGGIYAAQQMLRKSTADNKLIVVLTDGCANLYVEEEGSDIARGEEFSPADLAVNQANIARNLIPNLQIMTIGLDVDNFGSERLRKMSSLNEYGEKISFLVNTGDVDLNQYLVGVFANINYMVDNITYEHRLVDYLPEGIKVYNNMISCNDKSVNIINDDNEGQIRWYMGYEQLEKKIYHMSFVAEVDFEVLPEDYFENNTHFYTNGFTMDINEESSDSVVFTYSKNNEKQQIGLESPQLSYYEKDTMIQNKDYEDNKIEEEKKIVLKIESTKSSEERKEIQTIKYEEKQREQINNIVLLQEEKVPTEDTIINKQNKFITSKLDKTPKTGYTDKEMDNLSGPYKFNDTASLDVNNFRDNNKLYFILSSIIFLVIWYRVSLLIVSYTENRKIK